MRKVEAEQVAAKVARNELLSPGETSVGALTLPKLNISIASAQTPRTAGVRMTPRVPGSTDVAARMTPRVPPQGAVERKLGGLSELSLSAEVRN